MKNWIIASAIAFFGFMHINLFAQSDVLAKDTKWLETHLNTLTKESKSDTKEKQFKFDKCRCEFKAANKNSDGFNFNMNYSFDLNEVNAVSYASNDDKSYDLIIKLKTEEVAKALNFNSFTTTLYNTDENKVKEIISKFKSSIKTCSAGNKKSGGDGR